MYENMCRRWDRLGYIQTQGQGSLWDTTIEDEIIDDETICDKMKRNLSQYYRFIPKKKVLAEFYSKSGVLCQPATIE